MRALLAFLLLHPNEPISSDRLIDQVWGPDPPKTAAASLQNYVSRLRKAIGPELIASRPPAYVLRVDPQHFDLARFERLVAEARGARLHERAEKLRTALALWRGRAFEDLAFEPFIRDEAGRLEEARLAALEERIDADLALGAEHDLVVELEALVEEHPLRERFRAQLMLALYRAGRQAEALEAYREARRVLMDELGLEPSQAVRSLQQAILRQEPSLAPPELAAIVRSPDRRTVTVLFCDLVDSTKLAAELDPEVYGRLMSRYFELVREPIERHGGTLEKFVGDAVMALFGVPELHEDDALRAVRAADEAQAALREEASDVPLVARIGVSTGEVHVLSSPGQGNRVSGAAARIAAQLEESAPAGCILLSEETHRLVRDAVRSEPVGGAWRVDEVLLGAPPFARRLDAPLMGRGLEFERLRTAYTNACDGNRCGVVTVVGEAGIGKTRLARELVTSLHDEARVLVGRCVSYGEGATYLPIAEIVRHAAGETTLAGIRALLDGEEDADAVAQRLAQLIGISDSPSAPGEAFWAVRRLLEAAARERPVLVVFDDLHWAEATLVDLIEYLGEWAEGPILIVCLARNELLETRPGWGGPTSTGFLVALEPLAPSTLSALLEQFVAGSLDPRVQERIVEHAGGNPLFAEQLLAFAGEAPARALQSPPPNIEALLASRLDHLDARELAVLRRAAVLGRRFSPGELEDLGGEQDSRQVLLALTEKRLVRPVEDLYRFHHVLVRDVAYRGITKADRAELHERAARGLDRRNGADELVGYHLEQAYRFLSELDSPNEHSRELAQRAGEHLGHAGVGAWKRADAPAAINLLSRAVDLVPDATELACELGTALNVRGESVRGIEVLTQAAERAAHSGEERLELRARMELAFGRSVIEPDHATELLDLAATAIPVFEAEADHRALGRAWFSISHIRGGFFCEFAAMEDAAARAATHYQRAGWSPSSALGNLGSALYFGPTSVERAVARCKDLLGEYENDRASEANVLLWLGGLEAMLGDFEDGRRHTLRARSMYRELGLQVAATDSCSQLLGAIEMLAGSAHEAEETLRPACEMLERIGRMGVLATRAGQLAEAIYVQGRHAEAERWTEVARRWSSSDDLDAAVHWQPVQARVLAARGAIPEAEHMAREILGRVEQTDALNYRADASIALAEILRIANRPAEANETTLAAIRLYERKGNVASAMQARRLLPEIAVAD
jgi:DNA-binding SARP family transcriptional activator